MYLPDFKSLICNFVEEKYVKDMAFIKLNFVYSCLVTIIVHLFLISEA